MGGSNVLATKSAGSRLCSHVVGAAVRRCMQHSAAHAMSAALQVMRGSEAGRAERSLYRAIANMLMNRQRSTRLWGTPTKLSAIYRIWRQILEDAVHKCVALWRVNQRAGRAGARAFKFFYQGKVITGAQQIT